ncbi:MAG TPA: hypothetical protein VJK07_03980 [Candidatus Nanoarchaeia archaeon]|nr:hypothetical protein [Candidatus Nanoarchaeia archaeon]
MEAMCTYCSYRCHASAGKTECPYCGKKGALNILMTAESLIEDDDRSPAG